MNRDERTAELASRMENTSETEKLWAKGEFRRLTIFRVPVDLLVLNAQNRRFSAERQRFIELLGREFDPVNPQDEESLISLLLDDDHSVSTADVITGRENKDTLALRADWDEKRQEHALWIRPWGLVANGNRRLAMLKRRARQDGGDAWKYVEIVVLPEDEYDDDELFDMEAREQLTEGLKVRYSDINLLLTLQEAADRIGIDWEDDTDTSLTAVALQIQHLVNNNSKYAEIQLRAVRYMQLYLEMSGRPGRFHGLVGKVEMFRDIGKNMYWVIQNDPSRKDSMLRICFAAVAARSRYNDVRDLRKLAKSDPDEFDRVVAEVAELEEEGLLAPDDGATPPPTPTPSTGDEDDDEDETDESWLDSEPDPPYPIQPVKRRIDRAVASVRDSDSPDPVQNVLMSAQRLKAVDQKALDPTLAAGTIEAKQLRDALDDIIEFASHFSK